MKKLGALLVMALAVYSASSQEECEEKETLLKGNEISGAFLGTTIKVGELNSQEAFWIGGDVGIIFDEDLGIGLAGYGLVNSVRSDNASADGNSLYFQSGYGGLLIEPALFENKVFSLSFPSLFGLGGIAETSTRGLIDEVHSFELEEDEILGGDVFWVLEPGAQLNLNVTRWMKINAGVSYRKAYGLDLPNSSSKQLDGLQGTVSLRLGWL